MRAGEAFMPSTSSCSKLGTPPNSMLTRKLDAGLTPFSACLDSTTRVPVAVGSSSMIVLVVVQYTACAGSGSACGCPAASARRLHHPALRTALGHPAGVGDQLPDLICGRIDVDLGLQKRCGR